MLMPCPIKLQQKVSSLGHLVRMSKLGYVVYHSKPPISTYKYPGTDLDCIMDTDLDIQATGGHTYRELLNKHTTTVSIESLEYMQKIALDELISI